MQIRVLDEEDDGGFCSLPSSSTKTRVLNGSANSTPFASRNPSINREQERVQQTLEKVAQTLPKNHQHHSVVVNDSNPQKRPHTMVNGLVVKCLPHRVKRIYL